MIAQNLKCTPFLASDYENPVWWHGFPKDYQPQQQGKARSKSNNSPRDTVSWFQCVAFCRWISAKLKNTELNHPSGKVFNVGKNAQIRLPTEWEWQWVAQNGEERHDYPWGEWREGYANTMEAGLSRSIAVGMYPHGATNCGALDMSGNVFEWCLNNRNEPHQIEVSNVVPKSEKGGSFKNIRTSAKSSARNSYDPHRSNNAYGFRLVLAHMVEVL